MRRLAVLPALAVPLLVAGLARATWGAAPVPRIHPREAHVPQVPPPLVARAAAADRSESSVILFVLDGVRWQDVFYGADLQLARASGFDAGAFSSPRGLIPNLSRLTHTQGLVIGGPARRHVPGSAGAWSTPEGAISASGPNFISLPGYREIFAGHPDSSCDTNDCPRPTEPTLTDDIVASTGRDDVALVTSWPVIATAASSSSDPAFLVSAGRKLVSSAGALRDDAASEALLAESEESSPVPGEGDYRPDALTAALALRVLEVARPRFLFVGLGDADEHAHRGSYRGYLQAVHAADAFLGALVEALRGMGARGEHTTILVTTDHGRAYDFRDHGGQFPESARVWLAALGRDLRGRGAVGTSAKYTLSNVAPTVRALLGMKAEATGEAIAEVVGDRR
jgi:hypothetical protein